MFQQVGKELENYEHVWERGIGTLRRLITNQAPKSIEEVIRLILVASAMRMTVTGEDLFGDRDVFLADLDRWRSIMDLEEHQSLFDEIVLAIWGKVMTSELSLDEEDLQGDVAYLGSLLRSLVRQTLDQSYLKKDSNFFQQPSRQRNSSILEQPAEIEMQSSISMSIPREDSNHTPMHEAANSDYSSQVIMLMAGASFAGIVLCLLSNGHPTRNFRGMS